MPDPWGAEYSNDDMEDMPPRSKESMMPSDEQMREAIKRVYSHPNWGEKVDDMSDKQVAAIYLRLLNQKKL